jgi:hypothetical protein
MYHPDANRAAGMRLYVFSAVMARFKRAIRYLGGGSA